MLQNYSNFQNGTLDRYRQLASFNSQQLKVFLSGKEHIVIEKQIAEQLAETSEFFKNSFETLSLDESRRQAVRKMFIPLELHEPNKSIKHKIKFRFLQTFNPSVDILRGLNFEMVPSTLRYLGTERHAHFANEIKMGKIIGCFALTEIGHGSNTKGMKTTATYDIQSKQFIINSPDFEAAKCWVGLLGHLATHAVVFAHLTTPDGVKRGLHAFIVPVRDPLTLLPYPGLTIIDMGEKIGLNAIDNGVVMFKNYRIPRENLLNRHSDVTEDGTYTTAYKDASKQHGATFGNLSTGRVEISMGNVIFLTNALTIAIRYAAVRKQFGIGNGDEEVPILEYQTHQYRLLPYLAAVYCLDVVCNFLFDYKSPATDGSGRVSELTSELHAISSALKAVSGWIARDGIQECREACGGHGYLKAAGFGALKNDQDASCTYEGANHVLLQQTSAWILKLTQMILNGKQIVTPFKSLEFFNNIDAVSTSKFSANTIEDIIQLKTILQAYQWMIYYLLRRFSEKYQSMVKETNPIIARNNCQVYVANDLATAYIEHYALVKMCEKISTSTDPTITLVLTKLTSLYGLWSLNKHIATLYIGGYAEGPAAATLIQDAILKLCADLKNEAVALIDVIAPPDFLLNSVLGNSDGQVYKHLEAAMMQAPGALSRPTWWKEIVHWKDYVKPKL